MDLNDNVEKKGKRKLQEESFKTPNKKMKESFDTPNKESCKFYSF